MQEHPAFAEILTHYLALGTILGAILVVICAIAVMYKSYNDTLHTYARRLGNYIFPVGFFAALGGMILTLYYQYWLNYEPCDLCWYQRVFLYPLVFLFAYAWYKKDRAVLPYALILSIVGAIIATYHHLLQIGFDIMKPCSTAPFAVDCSKPSFIEFGFVTFPFMAAVLFALLVLVITIALHRKDSGN